MTIQPDELAHAQKLCDEATQNFISLGHSSKPGALSAIVGYRLPEGLEGREHVGELKRPDAVFYAYARNNLPRYLAAVRELQDRVQKLEDAKQARDDLLCRCKSLLRDDGDPYGDDDATLVHDIDAALDGKV